MSRAPHSSAAWTLEGLGVDVGSKASPFSSSGVSRKFRTARCLDSAGLNLFHPEKSGWALWLNIAENCIHMLINFTKLL